MGLAFAQVAQAIIILCLSLAVLRHRLPGLSLVPVRWNGAILRELVSFGWKFLVPLAIINIVLTATLQWSPLFDYVSKFLKTSAGWLG